MPSIDYTAAAAAAPLGAVLRLIGWERVRVQAGQQLGYCPLCRPDEGKKKPRFYVRGEKWKCFECEAGGGPLTLYAAWSGLPIHPATQALFRALGLPCPYLPRGPRKPRPPRSRECRP